jgi:hypothetical protein
MLVHRGDFCSIAGLYIGHRYLDLCRAQQMWLNATGLGVQGNY